LPTRRCAETELERDRENEKQYQSFHSYFAHPAAPINAQVWAPQDARPLSQRK
jgi:hypothetical protein